MIAGAFLCLAVALPAPEPGRGDAARAALARSGAAGEGVDLRWRATRPLGAWTVHRYERRLRGVPVLGGDALAAVDEDGGVRLVRATVLPPARGEFRVPEDQAARAALSSTGRGARAEGSPSVRRVWIRGPEAIHPSYEVTFMTSRPAGSWRAVVDAETGAVRLRQDLLQRFRGRVYELSPSETLAAACPLEGALHSTCASPIEVELLDLTAPDRLEGTYGPVLGCDGAFPTDSEPSACAPHASPDGSELYGPDPDATGTSFEDAFAEVQTYHHLARSARFLRTLDPEGGFPFPNASPFQTFVNVGRGGSGLDDALYDELRNRVVVGQGAATDYAYDPAVLYHELVHAAVARRGSFWFSLDELGTLMDGGAASEGTADALAAVQVGRPALGLFAARALGLPELRRTDVETTCRGRGTLGSFTGLDTVDGRTGHDHLDGQIWSSFLWDLHVGLREVPACDGACDAAALLQLEALALALDRMDLTLATYADDVVAAAEATFPDWPGVAAYVRCIAARHDMAGCASREAPLYAGEPRVVYVPPGPSFLDELGNVVLQGGVAGFQVSVPVAGDGATITACGRPGSRGTLHLRHGAPARIVALGTPLGVEADVSVRIEVDCPATTAISLPGGGTWFGLAEADPRESGSDAFQIRAGEGVAPRPAPEDPAACVLDVGGAAGGLGGCSCGGAGGGGPLATLLLAATLRCRRRAR